MSLVGIVVALVVAHECGHAAAARLLGLAYRVGFRRHPFRVVIAVMFPGDVVAWQNVVIAAAGPLVSFAGAVLWFVSPPAAVASVLVGGVSLVPYGPSDGRKIAAGVRRMLGGRGQPQPVRPAAFPEQPR